MQPTALAIFALLAPLPAAAFGDLDCITIEYCGDTGCGTNTTPFGVTFDWAADAVVLSVNGEDLTLPWTETGDTGTASTLAYGDMDDINHLLRIEALGEDITAYYTFRDPLVTTWRAVCDVRRAA